MKNIESIEIKESDLAWRRKISLIISRISTAAYYSTNLKKDGSLYTKHRPYTVPKIVDDLKRCLDLNDEKEAKRLMMWDYYTSDKYIRGLAEGKFI